MNTQHEFPTSLPEDFPVGRPRFAWARSGEGVPTAHKFEIAVPEGWEPLDCAGETRDGFAQAAVFAAPEGCNADIQILATRFPRDAHPADLLEIWWENAGAKILARRGANTPAGSVAEFLLASASASGVEIWRSRIVRQGDRLYRIEARSAEDIYPDLAIDIFISLASFRVLTEEDNSYVEEILCSSHTSPVPFTFNYPASWTRSVLLDLEDRSTFQLNTPTEGTTVGQITIDALREDSSHALTAMMQGYSEQLRRMGVRVGGAPVIPVRPPEGFTEAATYSPTASYEESELDTRAIALRQAEVLMLLCLLSPARNVAPEQWAINKRAFEIVRDSLQIGPAAAPG